MLVTEECWSLLVDKWTEETTALNIWAKDIQFMILLLPDFIADFILLRQTILEISVFPYLCRQKLYLSHRK